MENGGIFVAKARHLSLAGSMTNNTQSFIPMSPRVQQSPKHGAAAGGGASPWRVSFFVDRKDDINCRKVSYTGDF